MTSDRDTDLGVLSRRGALSAADTRRLRDLLQSSDEERFLHDAGLGFDAETPVVPGDDARIERMVRGVQAAKHPARRALRGRVARGALGVFLAAGVAAAGVAGERLIRSSDDSEAARTVHQVPSPAAVPRAMQKADEPRDAVPPAVQTPPPAAAPAPVIAAPSRASHVERERGGGVVAQPASPNGEFERAPVPAAVPTPTARFAEVPSGAASAPSDATTLQAASADALFAVANRERMSGNASGAIALYERLRAEFPRSTEAAACSVTLGVLYLQLGQADHALGAFRRSHPTAEALWGQAQALRQLGRAHEERAVLGDILRHHSGTAYATAAEKRLTELH